MPKSTQVPAVGDWIIVSLDSDYVAKCKIYGERMIIVGKITDHSVLCRTPDGEPFWLCDHEFYIV